MVELVAGLRGRRKRDQFRGIQRPRGAVQGDLGRNAFNGFGATPVDFKLRRQFKLGEQVSLRAGRLLQHQPPQLRPPDQLHEIPHFGLTKATSL
jgi:hypothetical protein